MCLFKGLLTQACLVKFVDSFQGLLYMNGDSMMLI